MRVFDGMDDLPYFTRPVATIGTFDGVHRGHRVLLGELLERTRERGGESVVITFDRHPRAESRLLTSHDEKIALLETEGVDNVIVMPFTNTLRRLTAREFVRRYLVGKLGIAELVVGFDNRIGSDRSGDLEALGREFGFAVTRAQEAPEVSSSRIRELLRAGRTEEARELLGR